MTNPIGTATSHSHHYQSQPIPAEVVLAWTWFVLRQEFGRTGMWPMPPGASAAGASTSNLNDLPFIPSAPAPAAPAPGHAQPVAWPGGPAEMVASGMPVAKALQAWQWQTVMDGTPAPTELTKKELAKLDKAALATGYRYRKSEYWQFACQLLADYLARTSEQIERDTEGCKLTLAAIVAWLRFPLFGGGAGRQWMTIGFDRLRKELGMQAHRLMDCLTQLQEIRLLQPFRAATPFGGNYAGEGLIGRVAADKDEAGQIFVTQEEFDELKADCAELSAEYGGGPGGFWHARAIQKKSNFYRFKPVALTLDEQAALDVLPVFNPFQSQAQARQISAKLAQGEVPANQGSTSNQVLPSAQTNQGSTSEGRGKDVLHTPLAQRNTSEGRGYSVSGTSLGSVGHEKDVTSPSQVLPTSSCTNTNVVSNVVDVVVAADSHANFQAKPEGKAEPEPNQASYPAQGVGLHSSTPSTDYQARLSRLTPDQLSLHNQLLNLHTLFEGFTGKEVDPKTALDLAERVSLAFASEVIRAVVRQWSMGEIRKTPIGLVLSGLRTGFVPGNGLSEADQAAITSTQQKQKNRYNTATTAKPATSGEGGKNSYGIGTGGKTLAGNGAHQAQRPVSAEQEQQSIATFQAWTGRPPTKYDRPIPPGLVRIIRTPTAPTSGTTAAATAGEPQSGSGSGGDNGNTSPEPRTLG